MKLKKDEVEAILATSDDPTDLARVIVQEAFRRGKKTVQDEVRVLDAKQLESLVRSLNEKAGRNLYTVFGASRRHYSTEYTGLSVSLIPTEDGRYLAIC